MKWELGRQGVPGVRERWSPGIIVGTAFHAGMAAHMVGPGNPGVEVAEASLVANWPSEDVDTGEFVRETVVDRMLGAVRRAQQLAPALLEDEGNVVAVEDKLGPGDRELGQYPGTADLITEHGPADGRYLAITDWKTHWSLDDYYVEKELSETERNWQLHQYAYFARLKYGKPVKVVRKVVVRCLPSPKAWVHAVGVDEARLDAWYHHALPVWDLMDTKLVWPNWQSCRKYGKCEYYYRCHGEGA